MSYLAPQDLPERRQEVVALLASPAGPALLHHSAVGDFKEHPGTAMVFTAPHEMPQLREGQVKQAESGSGLLAAALAAHTGGSAFSTSGEQSGDPNWDEGHPFTLAAVERATGGWLVDLHMMRPRGVEVCLGLGPNYEMARPLWVPLLDELLAADVRVSLNWPFGARGTTVTSAAQRSGVPAVQVEMAFEVFDDGTDAQACVVSALMRASRTWC